jgi:hypothetical protein
LTVEASGASDVELASGDLDELVLGLSGASHASIRGTASLLRADVSGASRLAQFDLDVDEGRWMSRARAAPK